MYRGENLPIAFNDGKLIWYILITIMNYLYKIMKSFQDAVLWP